MAPLPLSYLVTPAKERVGPTEEQSCHCGGGEITPPPPQQQQQPAASVRPSGGSTVGRTDGRTGSSGGGALSSRSLSHTTEPKHNFRDLAALKSHSSFNRFLLLMSRSTDAQSSLCEERSKRRGGRERDTGGAPAFQTFLAFLPCRKNGDRRGASLRTNRPSFGRLPPLPCLPLLPNSAGRSD